MSLDRKLGQSDFGYLVGISQQAVSGLLARGVLADGSTAREWLLSYCHHIREQAAGRAALGDLDLATERARLSAAQALRVELQNKITVRKYAPVSVITESLASVGRQIAGILEALPVKLKRNTAMKTEQIALIEREIAEARNLAASMQPDWSQIDESAAD